MTVPATAQLRRILPLHTLRLVSRPGTADLFIDADFIDEVLVYDRTGLSSAWEAGERVAPAPIRPRAAVSDAFEAAAIAFWR